MANTIRTVDQIVQDMINFIISRQPNIATQVGSVVNDVVVSAPSQEFENVYVELNRISQIQSLEFPNVMTSTELNSLGDNYGLTRNSGTQSQTNVTFRVVGLQASEPNIIIPIGSIVTTTQTPTSAIISFATTASGTFISSQAAQYFNPLTGFYELILPVQSQSIGISGNVNAGAINVLASAITRIFAVINTVAATGGTDQESNDSYATRIKLKLSGNNLGTPNGLESLALTNPQVASISIVGPNDPEMLRNEFGGSIDIYILGSNNVSTTDTFAFINTNSFSYTLFNQPATVTSGSVIVQGIVSGSPHVFIQGTDYSLFQDPTTLFNGSADLQNGIRFLASGTLPDNNTQFTVTYAYNQLIPTLQNIYNTPSNHIVGSDILVKEAIPTVITVSASIGIISGFNASSVISAASTALTNFLVTNTLGATFSQSQIVAVIENTPGVNEVDLTTLVITKDSLVVTSQIVTITKTQFIELTSVNLSVS